MDRTIRIHIDGGTEVHDARIVERIMTSLEDRGARVECLVEKESLNKNIRAEETELEGVNVIIEL